MSEYQYYEFVVIDEPLTPLGPLWLWSAIWRRSAVARGRARCSPAGFSSCVGNSVARSRYRLVAAVGYACAAARCTGLSRHRSGSILQTMAGAGGSTPSVEEVPQSTRTVDLVYYENELARLQVQLVSSRSTSGRGGFGSEQRMAVPGEKHPLRMMVENIHVA
jgi:hypothetical protein